MKRNCVELPINDKKILTQELRKILCFNDDDEKLEFEAEMLHMDIMHQVKMLMAEYGMNKNLLAEKLNISNDYLSDLFSGDELVNLKLLAKFQRIFDLM
ncbi:MAG: helix-turn-helix transcriptional regulator [Desulfobacteraceae bacterium]|nr:helix-turn-helix transcriptional regulator [Desulfobacteraceae bacterium]